MATTLEAAPRGTIGPLLTLQGELPCAAININEAQPAIIVNFCRSTNPRLSPSDWMLTRVDSRPLSELRPGLALAVTALLIGSTTRGLTRMLRANDP